jgi:hypothetical protein
MVVQIPPEERPTELVEQGPGEDPFILLAGPAAIGRAPHRVLALRVNPVTLAVDYRRDLDEEIYADLQLEEIFDEVTFLADIHRSALFEIEGSSYVFRMTPFSKSNEP